MHLIRMEPPMPHRHREARDRLIPALLTGSLALAAPAAALAQAAPGAPEPTAAASLELEPIVATGEARPAAPAFVAPEAGTGPFRGVPQADAPVTLNVVPRAVLEAQGARSIHDALRNTAGVTRAQLNGAVYDNLSIRGIPVENRTNYLLEGVLPVINLIDLPLEHRQRVEVLKGVSALTHGFGTPSGIVNLANLRATRDPVAALSGAVTSHGGALGHLDLGRLSQDGRWGLRLNALGGHVATGIERADGWRGFLSTALDWRPTETVTFSLDAEYIRKDVAEPPAIALLPPGPDGRIPLPRVPNPRQNLGGAWQRYDAEAVNLLARGEWRFAPGWAASLAVGRAETSRDRAFAQFQDYSLATGAGRLQTFLTRGQDYQNHIIRAEVTGSLRTGPVEHDLRLGASQFWRDQNGIGSQTFLTPQNLFNPIVPPELRITRPLPRTPFSATDQGLYLMDRMSVLGGRVQLTGGVRFGRYESEQGSTTVQRFSADTTSPMVALVVKPLPWLSLYGSYLEGLEEGGTAPANTVNANEVLPPAVSTQWEVGVKADPLDGRLLLTLGRFELDRPSAFTNSQRRFVQDGRTLYRGWEVSAIGQIAPDWAIYATALFLDAEQERASDPRLIGRRPENTPRFAGSLFAEHRADWLTPGLRLSAGVFHVGARPANNLNQAFVEGYATLSLGAAYDFEVDRTPLTARLIVDNATNARYWNSAGNGLLGVGLPLTAIFSLTARL